MGRFTKSEASDGFYDASAFGTADTLQRYRRNGVPLMPSQVKFLRANGVQCGKDAMLGRKAKGMDEL